MTFAFESLRPQPHTPGVSQLAQLERLARYRELAADARRCAKTSPKETQHCYLLASEWWRDLATDLENHIARADAKG
jgi:hypothetical protein